MIPKTTTITKGDSMSTFRVQDMTCSHCEKSIKSALVQGNHDIKVQVHLDKKQVVVENLADNRVVFLLKELGYNAEKIKH